MKARVNIKEEIKSGKAPIHLYSTTKSNRLSVLVKARISKSLKTDWLTIDPFYKSVI
ncbi:hypothetical protein [Aquimarina agarilytica]|uniref:hypothetical protein n=1 Tax=Aquimarina agarilytica TaxID=1087449 RepID=UPI0002F57254|nr:hypothetical protein [Aquimarina agarilytica]